MNAGAKLSWVVKTVRETTSRMSEWNSLIVRLVPSAPLFQDSVISLSGLFPPGVAAPAMCFQCDKTAGWTLGMGCSSLCAACDNPAFPLDPGRCAVIADLQGNPHPAFVSSLGFFSSDGTLVLTVSPAHSISDLSGIQFAIRIRNSDAPQLRRECNLLTSSLCLQVVASSLRLCDPLGPPSTACTETETFDATGSTAQDAMALPLYDTCGTCLRPADLFEVNLVLSSLHSLVLQEVRTFPPSLAGLPVYQQGTIAPGVYQLQLRLTNWLGQTSAGMQQLLKDQGSDWLYYAGAPQPTLVIQHSRALSRARDQPIQLTAVAKAADCLASAASDVLQYQWGLTCEAGLCLKRSSSLASLVISDATRVLQVLPLKLLADSKYTFTCSAQQSSIARDPKRGNPSASVSLAVPVRPLLVAFSGFSSRGPMAAASSFLVTARVTDPEADMSGLTSPDSFSYSWGCVRREITGDCSSNPATPSSSSSSSSSSSPSPYASSCASDKLLPCEDGTLVVSQLGSSVTVSSARLGANLVYELSVNVTRRLVKVSTLIYDPNDPTSSVPAVWFQQTSASDWFYTVASPKLPAVSLQLCSSLYLGKPQLCQDGQTSDLFVNADDKLVLDAAVTASTAIASYEWSTESLGRKQLLNASLFLSKSAVSRVVLGPRVFVPGMSVVLRLDVRDSLGLAGFARLELSVRLPPSGGSFLVSPSAGLALATSFSLAAEGWGANPDELPLEYEFAAALPLASSSLSSSLVYSRGTLSVVNTSLPLLDGQLVTLTLTVRNFFQTAATLSRTVTVSPPSFASSTLASMLDTAFTSRVLPLFRVADVQAVQVELANLAMFMNRVPPCLSSSSSSGCSGTLEERQTYRGKLLLNLVQANLSLIPTPETLYTQVTVIAQILERPEELDLELTGYAANILSSCVHSYRYNLGDVALDVQEAVTMLTATLTSVLHALHVTSTAARRRTARPTSSSSSGDRLRAVELTATQTLGWSILRSVAALSSLSVSQSDINSLPVVIRTPRLLLNTSRVPASFLAANGWVAQAEGLTPVTASIPNSFTSQFKRSYESYEIMLAVFNDSFADELALPARKGPLLALDLRPFGSADTIALLPDLPQEPIKIQTPVLKPIDLSVSSSTGMSFSAFGAALDSSSWSWSFSNIKLVNILYDVVVFSVATFDFYSLAQVDVGCDLVPLSGVQLDSCRVCGGDNSSCSGCDGIPNTGRDKNCSGHGACQQGKCACVSEWYDLVCSSFCSSAIHCSGHGICDPTEGRSCFCSRGYSSPPAAVYPGPFCGIQDATGAAGGAASTAAAAAEAKSQLDLFLKIGIPCAVGSLLLGILLFRCCTWKQRRIENMKKTIIVYPQPQLLSRAEQRPDPAIIAPDDNGWTNLQLPVLVEAHNPSPDLPQLIFEQCQQLGPLLVDAEHSKISNKQLEQLLGLLQRSGHIRRLLRLNLGDNDLHWNRELVGLLAMLLKEASELELVDLTGAHLTEADKKELTAELKKQELDPSKLTFIKDLSSIYSHGPSSGHLMSAVGTSVRTSHTHIGRKQLNMRVDRARSRVEEERKGIEKYIVAGPSASSKHVTYEEVAI
uniref:PKD/REJ-like domain-containing protein n=1 Tax=Hanusia phi TaxID=3032 RepID=A0A7S0ELC5_9CRYP